MLRGIKSKPKGIVIFAFLLIAGSIYKLSGFMNYDYYVFMFQQLPSGSINDRYIMSVAYRIVGISVAVGVMAHKEWARQGLILLSIITLLTVYWKHPFSVFENISIYNEYLKGINTLPAGTIVNQFAYPLYPSDLQGYKLVYSWNPKVSYVFFMLVDILFSSSILFYFTRKEVKKVFVTQRKPK